jgi:hypothetical protein
VKRCQICARRNRCTRDSEGLEERGFEIHSCSDYRPILILQWITFWLCIFFVTKLLQVLIGGDYGKGDYFLAGLGSAVICGLIHGSVE